MNKNARHLFFDLDKTVAPARQPILAHMYDFLFNLPHDIIIVSGQEVPKNKWQTNNLPTVRLGQNGNHATEADGTELWNLPLDEHHRAEILAHIKQLMDACDHDINHEWNPIEDRGAQITFSPIGNTAPVDIKMTYDPYRTKRDNLLTLCPFNSEELCVKIGGSTSLDYFHKERHKGANVARLIEHKGWNRDECIYFGDGLYPGGNDEAVIGVIETVAVDDHEHTYALLQQYFTR